MVSRYTVKDAAPGSDLPRAPRGGPAIPAPERPREGGAGDEEGGQEPPGTPQAQEGVFEGQGVAEVVLVQSPALALAQDVRKAEETYQRGLHAESTLAAYAKDWKRFTTWAAARFGGVPPLPLAPPIIVAYLGWLADEAYSAATITRFLSAAAHAHKEARCYFVRDDPAVSRTLKGIRRRLGLRQTKKAPLGLEALQRACARLVEVPEGRRLRAHALLTVGWWCMLRSANLVAIRREHIRFVRFALRGEWMEDDRAPTGFVLFLPESKTDQLKEGRDVAVYAQEDETVCAMRALRDYFAEQAFAPGDLIFPISERTVTRSVKYFASDPSHGHKSFREIEQCAECGEAAKHFASHSLRRGMATTLAQAGVPEREIMRQGGWKNERVMRGYIDQALLFQNNPTKGLAKKRDGEGG